MSRLSLTVAYDGRRATFEPETTVVVGRGIENDVVVVDTRVSRRHLEVVSLADGWHVRDISTANGTWADGRRWTDGVIARELRLRLGHPEDGPIIVFSVTQPDGEESSAAVEPEGHSSSMTTDLSALGFTAELSGEPDGPLEPIRLRHGLTLGRDTGNDVVLMDLLVSRRHAKVHLSEGGAYTVEDLGATNRTFVNGDPVSGSLASRAENGKGTTLHDGDILTVGRTRMLRAGERLYPLPPVKETGLEVTDLSYTLPSGRTLVSGLSCRVHGPRLLAVIGPSGAGKSTLLRLLAGQLRPSSGEIRYHDADVLDSAEIRGLIASVPQQTVAHGRLKVGDALRYAAELRLPQDISPEERALRVRDVLTELSLTEHVDTRVDRLSAGQQRRLSIGFELLTRPSLLLVDEPTAGLDPARVRQVMQLLRVLADGGRQVIITTHDLTYLELCDKVLVLSPGGRDAYQGPPDGLGKRFGTIEWADIFERLSQSAAPPTSAPPPPQRPAARRRPPSDLTSPIVRQRIAGQAWVVIRRQMRLLAANPAHIALHTALPVALALLALTVPGGEGLSGAANPSGSAEAAKVLVVLLVGAAFMGMAAPSRDLVAERAIHRHERAAGLLPESYLLAKLTVFAGIAVMQSVLLVGLFGLVRSGPGSAVLLGSPTLELIVAESATAIACTALGLAVSARVATIEQATVSLVVAVMVQFVLCGGIVPVSRQPLLQPFSWLVPAHWGYAAAAATVSLRTSEPEPLWHRTPLTWLGALLALLLLTSAFTIYTRRVLRGTDPANR